MRGALKRLGLPAPRSAGTVTPSGSRERSGGAAKISRATLIAFGRDVAAIRREYDDRVKEITLCHGLDESVAARVDVKVMDDGWMRVTAFNDSDKKIAEAEGSA
jgi:hypothetical protein